MNYYDTTWYQQELEEIVREKEEYFRGKNILITGARGMLGSMFVDAIMFANWQYGTNCKVYAVVRNEAAAKIRFEKYMTAPLFRLIVTDINQEIIDNIEGEVEYIVHGASNTHPLLYSRKPIETILTNVVGTNHLLEFAITHYCKRFLFLSSVEIYGENKGICERFKESDCGYIDSNTLRAGYPEGKRAGEALCQAYAKEYGLQSVILRLARCYGPGILENDSKALSQFLHRADAHEDIVLKSKGSQIFSYVYQADAVDALCFFLRNGIAGEAYNITGIDSDVTLRELAEYIAGVSGVSVVYELPSSEETTGYSTASRALLDGEKAKEAGWISRYRIQEGIRKCLL
ncbi:MAG: NAD-dependent epimerase/dehydratase family protein [Lachnospiraceae bacterium]|nr:NAD-dependent epimerase/dehydratase family protein [Lachnospiraceae bacterium]MDE7203528.1 NAD-dependent epimerase/dehydratase family protein [Lachnospiraceae bacterium]